MNQIIHYFNVIVWYVFSTITGCKDTYTISVKLFLHCVCVCACVRVCICVCQDTSDNTLTWYCSVHMCVSGVGEV